ncbi:PadR family transcriptional regulator [Amycolatopsis samaneae]|uniref:PadR family transcriptional regulator n=1 Tax=Amycolatopsis samaneae TaxID=664691 RepID=A0ABW5GET2_9PSEU
MAAAKLTTLGIAVLELLHERPMHPYEMAQLMRERHVDNRVKVKAGSLYHTVERLLGNGFIEVVDTQRDGRRPERTVYGMTGAGRDAFVERSTHLLGDVAEEYPEFLSGLAVIHELGRERSLRELERRITQLRARVAADRTVTQRLHDDSTPEIYWLDWRFTAARRAFELEWAERLLDELKTEKLPFVCEHEPKLVTEKENDERKTS